MAATTAAVARAAWREARQAGDHEATILWYGVGIRDLRAANPNSDELAALLYKRGRCDCVPLAHLLLIFCNFCSHLLAFGSLLARLAQFYLHFGRSARLKLQKQLLRGHRDARGRVSTHAIRPAPQVLVISFLV